MIAGVVATILVLVAGIVFVVTGDRHRNSDTNTATADAGSEGDAGAEPHGKPSPDEVLRMQMAIDRDSRLHRDAFCVDKKAAVRQPAYAPGVAGQWAIIRGASAMGTGSAYTTKSGRLPQAVDGEFSLGPPYAKGPQVNHAEQASLAICIVDQEPYSAGRTCEFNGQFAQFPGGGGTLFPGAATGRDLALEQVNIEVYELKTGKRLLESTLRATDRGCPPWALISADSYSITWGLQEGDLVEWGRQHLAGGTVR